MGSGVSSRLSRCLQASLALRGTWYWPATMRGKSCCRRFRLLLRSSPRFANGSTAACRHHSHSVRRLLQALKQVVGGITGAPQRLVLAGPNARKQLCERFRLLLRSFPRFANGSMAARRHHSDSLARLIQAVKQVSAGIAGAPATVRGNSCCCRSFRLLLRSILRFANGRMAACRHASHIDACLLNTELHEQEMAPAILVCSCKRAGKTTLACMSGRQRLTT